MATETPPEWRQQRGGGGLVAYAGGVSVALALYTKDQGNHAKWAGVACPRWLAAVEGGAPVRILAPQDPGVCIMEALQGDARWSHGPGWRSLTAPTGIFRSHLYVRIEMDGGVEFSLLDAPALEELPPTDCHILQVWLRYSGAAQGISAVWHGGYWCP
jgi:hypothetical protein